MVGFTGAAAAVLAGSYLILASSSGKPFPVPAYTVLRVIDGDTFETTERQLIRLSSVDAPELDRCWGEKAKKKLESLIVGKPVYLKVEFRDPYHRLISQVYTPDGSVNKAMIQNGNAYYAKTGQGVDGGIEIANAARDQKLGIFSAECTQKANPLKPNCQIKGNVRHEKIYYTPECGFYDQVDVELYRDDVWFCAEKEARNAGFRKPALGHDNYLP